MIYYHVVTAILCSLSTAWSCYAIQPPPTVSSIEVGTILSDTVQLNNQKPVAVIFAGGYACHACYRELEEAIRTVDSTVNIVVLLRLSGNSVIGKKEAIQRMARLVETREFYFDIFPPTVDIVGKYEGGLFGQYKVSICPSVLFLLPQREATFVSYQDLFNADKPEDNKEDENRCIAVVKEVLAQ